MTLNYVKKGYPEDIKSKYLLNYLNNLSEKVINNKIQLELQKANRYKDRFYDQLKSLIEGKEYEFDQSSEDPNFTGLIEKYLLTNVISEVEMTEKKYYENEKLIISYYENSSLVNLFLLPKVFERFSRTNLHKFLSP